jgi:cystathionine beta-lyase/cystathionine gamma-synthase
LERVGELNEGDLLWLETPINPFGTHFDIKSFTERAHERGVIVTIDATFAPPPLMDPFKWGCDYIMHSATKYLGGHSDLLAGVLVTKDINARNQVCPCSRVNTSFFPIGFILAVDLGQWSHGFCSVPYELFISVSQSNPPTQQN